MTRPDLLREMAEKLCVNVFSLLNIDPFAPYNLKNVKAVHEEIEEALRTVYEKAYREGQESMRERAAKIFDKQGSPGCYMCNARADQIRALELETERGG